MKDVVLAKEDGEWWDLDTKTAVPTVMKAVAKAMKRLTIPIAKEDDEGIGSTDNGKGGHKEADWFRVFVTV